jgi:hypothetical protein
MPAPSSPFKTIVELVFFGMTFRAAVVLLMMPAMPSKCLPFNISCIFENRKNKLGARTYE